MYYNLVVDMLKLFKYDNLGDEFRFRAYSNAIRTIVTEYQSQNIEFDKFVNDLEHTKIHGIGSSIKDKITKFLNRDPFPEYEALINKVKTPVNIHKHYMPRSKAESLIKPITDKLTNFDVVGSYRRGKAEIGDMDIIVYENDLSHINASLHEIPNLTWSAEGLSKDKLIIGDNELEVDIRACKLNYKGTMLLYFTGPAEFNVKLRHDVKSNLMKLSEYGITLYRNHYIDYNEKYRKILDKYKDMDEILVTFKDEAKVFEFLNLKYIEPKFR